MIQLICDYCHFELTPWDIAAHISMCNWLRRDLAPEVDRLIAEALMGEGKSDQ